MRVSFFNIQVDQFLIWPVRFVKSIDVSIGRYDSLITRDDYSVTNT